MHAVVVIGGSAPSARVVAHLPPDAFVVSADSGLDHTYDLGLAVDLVVGDLDSVTDAALARAERDGTPIERHPTDKDATDTELALDAALGRGADAITLVGGGGDRLDHLLGTLAVLCAPRLAECAVEAWVGDAWVGVVHGPGLIELTGLPGEYVSLIPTVGPALGVRTEGLRWRLDGGALHPASARGISNELVDTTASVFVDVGVLLVVRPHALRAG